MTLQDIIHTLPVDPSPLSFSELFGNAHPVELEIGTGKGGFLLEQARDHPERNYVGIEWARKYFFFAADRMARWKVSNVRMLRCDAKAFLLQRVASACLAAIHVYHPDPWPKRRHHRRRLFDPPFVRVVAEALSDRGLLAVQTDHPGYFEVIDGLLSASDELEQTLAVRQNIAQGDVTVPTNYQVKYVKEGRIIFRAEYRRRPR